MSALDPYRKSLVAALGVLVQILGLLATANDAGILPDTWRPWVALVVAIATAFGVYHVPNAALVAPKHAAEDEGSVA